MAWTSLLLALMRLQAIPQKPVSVRPFKLIYLAGTTLHSTSNNTVCNRLLVPACKSITPFFLPTVKCVVYTNPAVHILFC
ncbi:hypothetical protein AAY473_039819 [Plecturocebus cupreus]